MREGRGRERESAPFQNLGVSPGESVRPEDGANRWIVGVECSVDSPEHHGGRCLRTGAHETEGDDRQQSTALSIPQGLGARDRATERRRDGETEIGWENVFADVGMRKGIDGEMERRRDG